MMKDMMQQLRDTAIGAILKAENVESLEAMRIKYLGKKGELTAILKQMGSLSPEERPVMGQIANRLRSDIEEALDQRRKDLEAVRMALKLESETVDVTMPGKDVREGHKHPMYNVLDQIKDIFIGMGFEIVDGPEVELSKYNFTMLNIDESHPSREWTDTFYFSDAGEDDAYKRCSDKDDRSRPCLQKRRGGCHPLTHVPSDRRHGHRQRHHDGGSQGHTESGR